MTNTARIEKLENKYLEMLDPLVQNKMLKKSYLGDACSAGINRYIKKICKIDEQGVLYDK